jgi:serpin B
MVKHMPFILMIIILLAGCISSKDTDGVKPSPSLQPSLQPTKPTNDPNPDDTNTKTVKMGELVKSVKPYNTSPTNQNSEIQTVALANNGFSYDLYQIMRKEMSNLFYSPYSISVALAMTYAGARGNTATQMEQALRFPYQQNALHQAFNFLSLQLNQQGKDVKNDEGFRLNVTNSLWGQYNYSFLPEFLDVLAANYDAGIRLVDYVRQPEESRKMINDWVSQETNEKIKDLIPSSAINPSTVLVLANAIYFKANWQYPFDESGTKDELFHLLDGTQVTVPMMNLTKIVGYAEGENYQAVELPYVGDSISMVVFLPAEGQFDAFEEGFNTEKASSILGTLRSKNIQLSMPKFKIETDFSVVKPMQELGMTDAFNPEAADFSGMDGSHNLYISQILHKAFISVDEKGTEAAAATAVLMERTMAGEEPIQVVINRPFIFIIQDKISGAILFIGRLVSP